LLREGDLSQGKNVSEADAGFGLSFPTKPLPMTGLPKKVTGKPRGKGKGRVAARRYSQSYQLVTWYAGRGFEPPTLPVRRIDQEVGSIAFSVVNQGAAATPDMSQEPT
jgi:hypothetical protein